MERYVVIDLETTGHSFKKGDRIIQIGAVVIENEQIVERFASFIQPGIEIPEFITELTGIRDEDVVNAPTFSEVYPLLKEMLESRHFVAHNVLFDYSFLIEHIKAIGEAPPRFYCYDTVELSRILLPQEESYKLGHLAEQLGFTHDRPHQADSDAEVTAELFILLHNKLKALPTTTLKHLQKLTKNFRTDFTRLITPILLKERFEIDQKYDHFRALSLKKRVDEEEGALFSPSLTFDDFIQTFKMGDVQMKNAFHLYEKRQGQEQMMEAIYDAFSQNEHALIEASTGTGKSLAYLIPSAFYSIAHNQPVVISTQTIPLQDQLLTKDIPILQNFLPFTVKVAVLKGRNHYLCLSKFEQSLTTFTDDTYDICLTKAQILIWITETQTGDVEELSLPSGGNAYWNEVKSDASTDLGAYNPWMSRCFYYRAKKKAQQAHLIITNHALLLTDLQNSQSILPAYKHAIIDEAHHFEEVASNHLGVSTDYFTFTYFFQRLAPGLDYGSLERLKSLLLKYNWIKEVDFTKAEERCITIKEELDEAFRMIYRYVEKKQDTNQSDIGRMSYRYQSYQEKGQMWNAILENVMRIHFLSREWCKPLVNLCVTMQEQVELNYEEKSFLADFKSLIEQYDQHEQYLYELLLESDPNYVYWIEIEPKGARNAVFLYCRPIEVGEILADQFFTSKNSVILTSATLTVSQTFDYQLEKLGLNDFGPKEIMIPTSFDYEKQARLFLPTDMPSIKEVSEREFAVEVSIKLTRLIEETTGKMLVLFTSFDMLRNVNEFVKDMGVDVPIIAQGITTGSRLKLMKLFKQSERAVLFGTSSFWEGVDLPGKDLTQLVIVRLPFAPPGQPTLEAKLEKAKNDGYNPFLYVSLPQAIIRFKQGFGRLIRSKDDYGCIFILDKRISTTTYGKKFLESLPNIPIITGKLETLLSEAIKFEGEHVHENDQRK
ncbi:DNA replication protein dnaD [Bacillus sp. TS-2]|nr:DNA replication protein dnaD [Bacillus sp. TS-2]